jgi:hypothetical protein
MGKRDQSKKPKQQVRGKAADKQPSGAVGAASVMDHTGAMDGVSVPVEGDSRHISADERRKRNR